MQFLLPFSRGHLWKMEGRKRSYRFTSKGDKVGQPSVSLTSSKLALERNKLCGQQKKGEGEPRRRPEEEEEDGGGAE